MGSYTKNQKDTMAKSPLIVSPGHPQVVPQPAIKVRIDGVDFEVFSDSSIMTQFHGPLAPLTPITYLLQCLTREVVSLRKRIEQLEGAPIENTSQDPPTKES